MSDATEDIEHPTRTRRGEYRYLFTAKHHGGDSTASMWLPEIAQEVEFAIFDFADFVQIVDSRGWLYGVLREADGKLSTIGTWDEQVAEFQPGSDAADPWHGYPQWALNEIGPANRRKQQCRPEKAVFDRMRTAGMISKVQRKRFLTGRHA